MPERPRADHRAAAELVAEADRVGRDRGENVARSDFDALHVHPIGAVHAERVDRLELVDELGTKRVLERDLAGLDPARNEQDLLVLDVDALDGADALGERELLRRAERLGRVPVPVLPDDRGVQAFLDRRPDAEHRREREAGDLEVAAVSNMDLAHLVEIVLRGVGGEDVGQAGIHAHAAERELAARLPGIVESELLVAELQAG